MKVLIVSTNTLPASPSGPAYIAGAALKAGHIVEVFECLFSQNLAAELAAHLARFKPDVIGVSIRLVHGFVIDENAAFNTRHLDLRLRVKEVVDCCKRVSPAPIILGGPGFNYYGRDWLGYLDLDYGLRGEADFSFPLYLQRLAEGGDITTVPGAIFRREDQIFETPRELVDNLDATSWPAYELFDLDKYDEYNISPAILTKRGCAFRCTYCPYSSLEGTRYRLKSPGRVVDEIEHIQQAKPPQMVIFCDNNFNVPQKHAEAICQEIIARKLTIRWGTGSLMPRNITPDFCRLLRDSGCAYVNLSIESGSDRMLKRMRRGYTAAQIEQALACFSQADISFGASLLFGAPGETPATVAESLALLDRYAIPLGIWVTIGVCLWSHHQEVLAEVHQSGQYQDAPDLFEGVNYLSPELPPDYMIGLIQRLKSQKDYTVQVNKPYATYQDNFNTVAQTCR
ncbi:MAG: radical SAM protein [Chloroflexota bacterium]